MAEGEVRKIFWACPIILNVKDFALLAPKATNNTWYPYSFLVPPSQNEPWLSSALQVLKEIVGDLKAKGISETSIYFLGFSQGACLTLEFVTRNATGMAAWLLLPVD